MMRTRLLILMAGLWLAGCNLGLPQVTPTVAPTRTPLPTNPVISTQTATRIAMLNTNTPTPSLTASPSPTPTQTQTPTPTSSQTASPIPTVTPLPTIGPTRTPTPTLTPTQTPSLTATAPPTFTALPALSSTPNAFAPIGERPTSALAATLDATPTLVTAQAALAPVPATLEPTASIISRPPTPIPFLPAPTAIGAAVGVPNMPPQPNNLAFTLSISDGIFSGTMLTMPGGTLTFARSPRNPNQVALVDARGLLFIFRDFAANQGARIDSSPFAAPEPDRAERNNARVAQIAYSPDGRYLAFLVDTDSDTATENDSSNDGVWLLPLEPATGAPTGAAAMLLRDCPPQLGCALVVRPDAPYQYRSIGMTWSPQADAVLVTLDLPEEARRGLVVLTPERANPSLRPQVLRYDDGSWANDGVRLIVSGHGPDRRMSVGSVARDGGDPQLIDVTAFGLTWAQSAVQRRDGQIVFLGARAGQSSPLRLYAADGTPISGVIGSAAPIRAAWSPDHSAVLVVTVENGGVEYYIVSADTGAISRITPQVAQAYAVEWVTDSGSGLTSPPATPFDPSVPPISGRQMRVIVGDGLVVRGGPSLEADRVASALFGETVVIVGDPVEADGILWYPAVAPDGAQGWIAGRIGDRPTLAP